MANTSCVGVTVKLDEPDVSNTTSQLPGTQPLGEEAVQTDKQDAVTVEWGEPTDSAINGVCK